PRSEVFKNELQSPDPPIVLTGSVLCSGVGRRRLRRGVRAVDLPADDFGESDREPIGYTANSGSARRTPRRCLRCRRGGLESEGAVGDETFGEVRRRYQLRSGLHRQLRVSGKLQRLSGLGHLESAPAGAKNRVGVSGLAEGCVGVAESAVLLEWGCYRQGG